MMSSSIPGTVPGEWEAYFRGQDYPEGYSGNPSIVREIVSLLPAMEGRRILEVGPGAGVDAFRLSELGARVFVADPTATALQRIKGRFNGQLISTQGDGFQLPYKDEAFDLVFSQGLLEHFADPLPMLQEQVRVTRRLIAVLVLLLSAIPASAQKTVRVTDIADLASATNLVPTGNRGVIDIAAGTYEPSAQISTSTRKITFRGAGINQTRRCNVTGTTTANPSAATVRGTVIKF